MDRLTERFSNGQAASYWCGTNCKYDHKYCYANAENCPAMTDIYEKLAHYEDLAEQGRLVEVVRCKDCERYDTYNYSKGFGWCEKFEVSRSDNGYCDIAKLAEEGGGSDE